MALGRLQSRLELRIVEYALDVEELSPLAGRRGAALDQVAPGKSRRLPGIDFLDRVGAERHRPSHVVERDAAALHAEQAELQRLDHAAQARVARQHLHQALRLGQIFELRPELVGRFEEKAVLREERAALRLLDGAEQILLLRQALGQCIARLGDQFRRRRFDHGDDQFVLRECLLERHLTLPPRNVGGNQLVDVGGHGKMRRRVPRRCDRQYERDADDRPRIVHAKIDRADNKGSDCLHGPKRNAMVRDGMVGGSNRPLRRQEKGKMEALGSSSFVGAVHRRQSGHPCDIRRPIATP